MVDYEKSRKIALQLTKKLYDVRLAKEPSGLRRASVSGLAYIAGLQVLDLCVRNECFLEDFLHILETSDGTPKSHKERGV